MSLTASLPSSITLASAAVISILAALAATLPGFLPFGGDFWVVTARVLGLGPGILPASLVSHVAAHQVYSGGRVYSGLGDSFPLGRCWLPFGYCNALVGGTEVLLVSRLAGNIWGLWIAGFAKRFTRSSGMALSSTRACALTWLGSSPPEGRM